MVLCPKVSIPGALKGMTPAGDCNHASCVRVLFREVSPCTRQQSQKSQAVGWPCLQRLEGEERGPVPWQMLSQILKAKGHWVVAGTQGRHGGYHGFRGSSIVAMAQKQWLGPERHLHLTSRTLHSELQLYRLCCFQCSSKPMVYPFWITNS